MLPPRACDCASPCRCFEGQSGSANAQKQRFVFRPRSASQSRTNRLRGQEMLDLSGNDMFFPDDKVCAFQRRTDECLQLYGRLSNFADRSGWLLWTFSPKVHLTWHFPNRIRWLHPRRAACWSEEDFMKKIKQIAKRSAAGKPLHRVAPAVVQKYRWGLHFESTL